MNSGTTAKSVDFSKVDFASVEQRLLAAMVYNNTYWHSLPSDGTTRKFALKRDILYRRYWAHFHEQLPNDINSLPPDRKRWVEAFTDGYCEACGMDIDKMSFSVEWV